MGVIEQFPVGAPIQPVTWQHPGPKPVMIIGVYPSAAHARWVDLDGRTRIRAVAVANEPEPFWTGQDTEDHIATEVTIESWEEVTAGRFRSRMFEGGHFYWLDDPAPLLEEIRTDLVRSFPELR